MRNREKQRRGRGDLDAASIVLNLQKFHPAIFDCDAYRGGARVQAVLYEFFQGRGGPVNDLHWKLSSVPEWRSWATRYLSRGNLVNHGLLKPYYRFWLRGRVRRGGLVVGHGKP